MKAGSQSTGLGTRKWHALLLLLLVCDIAQAEDFAVLCADRIAIERVYYNHRTGTKLSFEQTLPRAALESHVRRYLKKETVLREHYRVSITRAMLDAEVQRINTTTRAPEMLQEIKAALGNNPERFTEALAKPFLVERLLRDKFENDEALHAPQRRECESVRAALLEAKTNGASPAQLLARLKQGHSNAVAQLTWQLASRSAETNASSADDLDVKKHFGPNAKLLSSRLGGSGERKLYFEDLPGELRNVLRVQLRQPGDVSAVIETPTGFLLCVCKEKDKHALTVACLSLPKRDYDQWLNEQNGGAR